jgi:hypothetical protein
MAFRDARGDAMTEADSSSIEKQLLRSYALLKDALTAR